jgi:hypothetical protein
MKARRNPTGIQWAMIAGGAATVGLAVYFISRPAVVAQTPVALPAPTPTPQPLRRIVFALPPPTTFSAPFGSGIALKVGQSVAISPPGAANPGQRWMFQATRNNANVIGLTPQARGDNTASTAFDVGAFVATAPGQFLIEASQFTPGAGGNTSPVMMHVLVTDPNGQGTLLPG